MRYPHLHTLLAATSLWTAQSHASRLNITAISASNNAARLECWQLAAAPTPGRGASNYPIGDFEGAFIGVVPPNTTTGTLSNAVQIQFSVFLSGLAYIRTPDSGLPGYLNEVYVTGGRGGMVIAADLEGVAAKGHVTTFPGLESTVIAQFPVRGGQVPEHEILHVGPCTAEDLAGL